MQDSKKDTIFMHEYNEKFEFNNLVASVFDDMIERSIPFYNEILSLSIYFVLEHIQTYSKKLQDRENLTIYDLGSSTGNLLIQLDEALKNNNINAKLYGIDNSFAMIERSKLKANAMGAKIKFLMQDFLEMDFLPTDIFLSFYTMQFVRPLYRKNIIQKIYHALKENGIFLFAEKVISQDSRLETQMIACYYEYKKKKGYSQSEIYKKREALENVLIPYSVSENLEMLKSCGFSHVEILFKWVNFTLFIAKK